MTFHTGIRSDNDNMTLECVVDHNDGRVRGLQAGIVNDSQEFRGFRIGFLNDGAKGYGFDLGVFNSGDHYYGLRIGLGNGSADMRNYGLDIGFYNFASRGLGAVQMGVVNNCENEIYLGVQAGLINRSRYLEHSMQAGAVNYCNWSEGAQLGAANIAETSTGLQLGLFNFSTASWNESSGIQIGLLNYRADNPAWCRYMPFISWKIGKKSKAK
ncbi:MAG: hypothetical protein PHF67_04365 [Candidatus Nanoarchaeia archaeon]|nr:hypothetical protein [Candidatus Nanoarchaeia archaeon]